MQRVQLARTHDVHSFALGALLSIDPVPIDDQSTAGADRQRSPERRYPFLLSATAQAGQKRVKRNPPADFEGCRTC
jgi:hypothetical protein